MLLTVTLLAWLTRIPADPNFSGSLVAALTQLWTVRFWIVDPAPEMVTTSPARPFGWTTTPVSEAPLIVMSLPEGTVTFPG